MNDREFDSGLARIEEVFGEMSHGLVKELRNRWLSTTPQLWERMISHVIENSSYAPKPKAFRLAYDAVLPGYKKSRGEDKCPHCLRGCGFNYVRYVWQGMPYEGVQPCRVCSIYQPRPRELSTPIECFITADDFLRRTQENAERRLKWEKEPTRAIEDM